MKKLLFVLIASFAMGVCFSLDAQEEVTIAGTEVRYVKSKKLDQTYKLMINFPGNYEELDHDIPVLYLMDSQWDFPLVSALYGQQYYDGFIPEMLVVGVTWGGEGDDPNNRRRRDYTPTKVGNNPEGGGADLFLEILDEEIFPYVEKEFKADPKDRALCGSSLGGLFTLHALFKRSDMFKRYFLTSPAIGWDNFLLYEEEEAYSKENHEDEKFLYLAHGEKEGGVANFNQFVDKIKARRYGHLRMDHTVLEGVGHSGTKPSGYTKGLQFIYDYPALFPSAKKMAMYEGKYKAENGQVIELVVDRGHLNFKNRFNSQPLKMVSKSKLVREGSFFKLDVDLGPMGKVKGFDLRRYGGSTHYIKVEEGVAP